MKNKIFIMQMLILALAYASTTILYFSQMNRLYAFFDPNTVYITSISIAYLAQAAGLFLFAFLCKKYPSRICSRFVLTGVMVAFLPILFGTLLISSGPVIMLLLIIANILIGYVLGNCFTTMATFVDGKHIGMCWGSAYAIGNLISWLISQIDAAFMTSVKIIPIVFIIIGFSLIPIMLSDDLPVSNDSAASIERTDFSNYIWLLLVILLMTVIYTIGSTDYSMIAETMTTSSTFYTRCLYAAGLFIAGLVYDKNRNLSSVFAMASIIHPIMASMLLKIQFQINLVYCLSFFFLGFLAVYRACRFISIGNEKNALLYLSCAGLLISRITEGIISFFNSFIAQNDVVGFILAGIMFIPLIIVFCMMILNQNQTAVVRSEEEKLADFAKEYNLTRREEQILTLLLHGATNGEISDSLTISEGTARFHVSNILKKTECKTRNDVVHKFRLL